MKRSFFERIRFQLAGAWLICILLPSLVRWGTIFPGMAVTSLNNALVGAFIAVTSGYFINRKFSSYPGVNRVASLIFAYSLPFLLVVIVFFAFQLGYSRFVFASSFFLALLWAGLFFLLVTNVPKIFVVPGGNAEGLTALEGVDWSILEHQPKTTLGISAIAADLRHDHADSWERFFADCALAGIAVYHTKQLAESISGKVAIEHLSENTFGSLLPDMMYLKLKQILDFLIALMALPFLLLLLIMVGPLIVMSSGWPVFFFQERMGHRGRVFKVVKFRTMTPSNDLGMEGAITKSKDSRVTPIGKILRKYRIDELPQIFNILRGEMSWIGPRPEALTLSHWYESELPFYRYRHVVMPGITGWAQVNQGHVASPDQVLEKLHYDFFYIKNVSPWLDLLIALKTIRTILTGFGSK